MIPYTTKICAAQLMFGLVEFEYRYWFSIELTWGRGACNPNCFLQISSSLVKVRLHTDNQLPRMPGSALKVCVGGCSVVVVESEFSDQLWLTHQAATAHMTNRLALEKTAHSQKMDRRKRPSCTATTDLHGWDGLWRWSSYTVTQ